MGYSPELQRVRHNLVAKCECELVNRMIALQYSEVAQLCPTLCDHMDCSLPGSSVHRVFQARILEWVVIS